MPGMMDTVLNLGLNDTNVLALASNYGARFAYDSYRRLLQMFGDVVLGLPSSDFELCLTKRREAAGVATDIDLGADDLVLLIEDFKAVYSSHGTSLPQDPYVQLELGIESVFSSWMIPRAIKYRSIHKIKGLVGTAVNVQAMVYGNLTEDDSASGVCFTRSPVSGIKELYGEVLFQAQGEEVVAGTRTPFEIKSELASRLPSVYNELLKVTTDLEKHMRQMLDVEFTIQSGKLFILQCRSGKRTGQAAVRIALDMANEGIVSEQEALMMVETRHLDSLLHPAFALKPGEYDERVLARGLAASPGAAVGRIVFDAKDAEEWKARGEQVILLREITSPEDIGGLNAAEGILTCRGGMTSHAAVVARGFGKPCICGVESMEIDVESKVVHFKPMDDSKEEVTMFEGDVISLNGTTGEVCSGAMKVERAGLSPTLTHFLAMADCARRLNVYANADTPEEAALARANGAEGIGLVRTEHMFFSTPERIETVRRMIAGTELGSPGAAEALLQLEAFQRSDFEGIFKAMDGLPVTIRLLDPPLHEFLPAEGSEALASLCKKIASELHQHVNVKAIKSRLAALHESNPMMGLRGCRLGIIHPEITRMQVRAIFEAAANMQKEGLLIEPKIMVPLVGIEEELEVTADLISEVAHEVMKDKGVEIEYEVGCMIEVPRGALQAGELAKQATFFSFGTNDLTQMTYGISRDDAEAKFLTAYVNQGILPNDPFETIDIEGVGELMTIAAVRARATNPELELGVCGEHGGDPASIAFFEDLGLSYVSCSPLRVPVARLAAAQALIEKERSAAKEMAKLARK